MARILLVGINYRPETTGIAPYTADLAEHYRAAGHDVTVVTGFPHYPAWRHEPGERRLRVAESIDGVRVLRRRHYVPPSQSALRRAAYEASFLLHGALSRPTRPDVVIGVVPSLSGGILARLFAARAGAPYALIFQDTMAPAARQSGIGGGARVAGMTAMLERWAVARAGVVAIASPSFRSYLVGIGVDERRIIDFPNWSHLKPASVDARIVRKRLGWSDDETIVLHAGNMGLKQGLQQVVNTARLAAEMGAPVRFVLMGEGSQRRALEEMAEGVSHLAFLPFQPEDEVPNILAAADALLVSERATVIDMSLPSKLTAYFAAGRPIIAAVPPTGATAREIQRSGAGVVVPSGDPAVLIDAVRQLRDDRERADALGTAGRRYADSVLDLSAAHDRMDLLLARMARTAPRRGRPARREDRRGYEVLGVAINNASFAEVMDRVLCAPERGERLSIHFATAHTLVEAHENSRMRAALATGTVEPDGMPLVWLGRMAGHAVERVCGPDFMPALIEQGLPLGRRHFFYGGAEGVPETIVERLRQQFPALEVAGTLSPPFRELTSDEREAVIVRINEAEPDYIWVGLGTPKQDLWLSENRGRLNASALLAVGAAFDLLAGRRRRAPRWMQRTGTEWIFRLATEPRRLGTRYTLVSARFVGLLVRDLLGR